MHNISWLCFKKMNLEVIKLRTLRSEPAFYNTLALLY